jgi:transketolase
VKYVPDAKQFLGLPAEPFYVSDQVKSFFAARKAKLTQEYNTWVSVFQSWQSANTELAKVLDDGLKRVVPSAEKLLAAIPEFKPDEIATRKAGEIVLQPL